MTGAGERPREGSGRLLRWYPAVWRERYGDELAALVEDELDGGHPGVRLRLSLARAGLTERVRGAGLVGDSRPAADRVRSGALLVLVAWAAAVVAGAAFAKTSEHFLTSGHTVTLGTARAAYAVVVGCAVTGALVVVAGALVALGPVLAFGRSGGWGTVRRPLAWATVATVLAAVAVVPLSAWAHHLDVAQRNGADVAYGAAFLGWGALVVAGVVLWTVAGVSVARRIELPRRALQVEAGLAVAGAGVLVVLTAAVGVWWWAMASAAPWFLVADRPGTHRAPVSVPLVSVGLLLAVAVVTAGYGAVRIGRSWQALAAG